MSAIDFACVALIDWCLFTRNQSCTSRIEHPDAATTSASTVAIMATRRVMSLPSDLDPRETRHGGGPATIARRLHGRGDPTPGRSTRPTGRDRGAGWPTGSLRG